MREALHIACHESYPGHHVNGVVLEGNLVRRGGRVELTEYPSWSPLSFIAEAIAEYGVELVFPPEERLAVEAQILFPMAGVDPADAVLSERVRVLEEQIAWVPGEIERRRVDEGLSEAAATELLMKYELLDAFAAVSMLESLDDRRSLVLAYSLGKDLVKAYVEQRAGSSSEARWRVFAELMASPRLPSSLGSVSNGVGTDKR